MAIELNTLSPKKWVASYSGITPTIDSSSGVRVGDFAIDTSTTPNRVWKCENATIGSPIWVPIEDLTKTMISTGILTGGILSINGGDNTKFDITSGVGYIVDNHTNPLAPVITRVAWSTKTGQTTPYRTTNPRTEVFIDSTGSLHLQTTVAPADMRDYIYIGKVIHNNLSTINAVNTIPFVAYNVAIKSWDLGYALGAININGNVYSANGANLNINKSGGDIYRVGSNYVTSKKIPNIYTSSAATALQFRYRYRDGSGSYITSALTSSIDPNYYDNNSGTLQSVGSNKFTIQRIYLYAGTDNTYVVYGQFIYNSLTDAKAAIPNEEPVIDPVLSSEGVLRCYLIVQQGTTALNNTTYNFFKAAGKLGEPMGGGAAGGDLVGPGSSVDNSIVRFDGTNGKLVQNGTNSTIDDNGVMTLVTESNASTGLGITNVIYSGSGAGSGAGLIAQKARGSLVSPSNVSTNDVILFLGAKGYGTTGFSSSGRGSITINAAENWTDTAQGTYITFQTTSKTSTSRTERVRIADNGDVNITGNLSVGGTVSGVVVGKSNVVTVTTSYSVTTSNEIILANTSSNVITVTLPTAIGNQGKEYIIKNIGASNTNSVTVTTSLSQKIDGESSQSYNYPSSMTVVSDNLDWWIV